MYFHSTSSSAPSPALRPIDNVTRNANKIVSLRSDSAPVKQQKVDNTTEGSQPDEVTVAYILIEFSKESREASNPPEPERVSATKLSDEQSGFELDIKGTDNDRTLNEGSAKCTRPKRACAIRAALKRQREEDSDNEVENLEPICRNDSRWSKSNKKATFTKSHHRLLSQEQSPYKRPCLDSPQHLPKEEVAMTPIGIQYSIVGPVLTGGHVKALKDYYTKLPLPKELKEHIKKGLELSKDKRTCPFHGKRFTSTTDLKRHLRTACNLDIEFHEFQCLVPNCHQGDGQRSNMENHIKNNHIGTDGRAQRFSCVHCGYCHLRWNLFLQHDCRTDEGVISA